MRSSVNTLLNKEMLCLYIVGGATSSRSSAVLVDCGACGENSMFHDSRRINRGVGSMGVREESGVMCARICVGVSSGTQSSTCS